MDCTLRPHQLPTVVVTQDTTMSATGQRKKRVRWDISRCHSAAGIGSKQDNCMSRVDRKERDGLWFWWMALLDWNQEGQLVYHNNEWLRRYQPMTLWRHSQDRSRLYSSGPYKSGVCRCDDLCIVWRGQLNHCQTEQASRDWSLLGCLSYSRVQ